MNRRLLLLFLAAALAGCASFDQAELNHVRSRGVSSAVVDKLEHARPVEPADVLELTRRGVRDEWIVRQIEDHGVDSYISRSDVLSLRRAGVRPAVIDALLDASRRFAENYLYRDSVAFDSYYSDDPFYDDYGPGYLGGGFGATVIVPVGGHFHHHHHHR